VLPFHCGPAPAGASATPLFFPIGTKFSPLLITGYQVTYGAWTRCGPQRWTDSSTNGHGNLPLDGNITGC
jgi:hypothetical protein